MDPCELTDGPRDLSRILHDEGSSAQAKREKRRLDRAPFEHVSLSSLGHQGLVHVGCGRRPRDQPSIVHIQPGESPTSILSELRRPQKRYNASVEHIRQLRSNSNRDYMQEIQDSVQLDTSQLRKPTRRQIDEPYLDLCRADYQGLMELKILGPIANTEHKSAIPGSLCRDHKGPQIKIANELLLPKPILTGSSVRSQTDTKNPETLRQTQPVLKSLSTSNVDVYPDPGGIRRQSSFGAPSQFSNLSPADLFGRSAPRKDSTQVGLSNEGPPPPPLPDIVYKRLLVQGRLHFIATRASKKPAISTDLAATTSDQATVVARRPLFMPYSSSGIQPAKMDDQEEEETMSEFKARLIYLIGQMMFVSGETTEPSAETTWMIEEIVREQVLEMLKEATILANRRGSKSISIVDLIFQIRHNSAKVSRLKTFLSWKDVRKNVKDSDDKAGADADALDLEDAAGPGANASAPQKTTTNKKAKLILPWEAQSFYSEQVPEREDEEDEEEEEQNEATLARLASADERTKNMTRLEYVYWSECRQASFTFRKGKRFREWAGFGTIIDSKPNDDVVDILGFLTFEIVQTLTEEALKVKNSEDLRNKKASIGRGEEAFKKRKREVCTLFEMPEEGRTPVEPRHVREAFRILQIVPPKYKFMRQGYSGIRTPLRMI